MESRMQSDLSVCYLCGKPLSKGDKHHVFNGAKRDRSEEDGMFIHVHRVCHNYIHNHPMTAQTIKARGQKVFEEQIGDRDEFIKRYGKSYL